MRDLLNFLNDLKRLCSALVSVHFCHNTFKLIVLK